MKRIIWFSLPFFIIIFFTGHIYAQFQPHQPYQHYGGALEYQIPLPTNYPPLTTDMPYDVLLGYVYFDSLSRTYSYDSLMTIIQKMGYSDTLRYAMKFLYRLDDYDPFAFFQYQFGHPGGYPYKVSPSSILRELSRQAAKVYPDSFVSVGLCFIDAICQIKVTDTLPKVDTTAPFYDKVVLVTAQVIDSIKGKVLPSCTDDIYGTKRNFHQQNITSENCMQFEYRLSWQGDIKSNSFKFNSTTLYDSTGKPWIQKDSEYIAFLSFINMGRDSLHNYAIFYPGLQNSSYIGLYAIRDGKVVDENNDFGFGTGLTVADFKTKLRQKINTLLMN